MPDAPLSFFQRLSFAFRILFDPALASRLWRAQATPELPPKKKKPKPAPSLPPPPSPAAALQLLALLQREGRLVDFLEQDVTSFGDAEIGAAARVVHQGCRKALRDHFTIAAVRSEEEGKTIVLDDDFRPSEIKLTGNVQGSAPYKGILRHKGWRAESARLPTPIDGHDPQVLAPAEVEL